MSPPTHLVAQLSAGDPPATPPAVLLRAVPRIQRDASDAVVVEPAADSALGERARGYLQLVKPGITRMVIATTLLGAISAPGRAGWVQLTWAVLGTALVVGGANALNMCLEWRSDALMQRTRLRPIPAGVLSVSEARRFAFLLAFVGLPTLWFGVNPLSSCIAALALVLYVWAYTPLKRRSSAALYVGAIPGAMPPLIGSAAASGAIEPAGLSLFAILFVWQIPHFHAISIFRRAEYGKAGIRVLPNLRGVTATRWAIAASSLWLLGTCLSPYWLGVVEPGYVLYAGGAAAAFLLVALWALGAKDADVWARRVFFASLPQLLIVFAALAYFAR